MTVELYSGGKKKTFDENVLETFIRGYSSIEDGNFISTGIHLILREKFATGLDLNPGLIMLSLNKTDTV